MLQHHYISEEKLNVWELKQRELFRQKIFAKTLALGDCLFWTGDANNTTQMPTAFNSPF